MRLLCPSMCKPPTYATSLLIPPGRSIEPSRNTTQLTTPSTSAGGQTRTFRTPLTASPHHIPLHAPGRPLAHSHLHVRRAEPSVELRALRLSRL